MDSYKKTVGKVIDNVFNCNLWKTRRCYSHGNFFLHARKKYSSLGMLFSGVKFDNRNKTWGTKRNTDAMALSILFFKLIKQLT